MLAQAQRHQRQLAMLYLDLDHFKLPPGAFIDVAKESGLIIPISRRVLREACHQAAAWRAAGWPDLVMAVNVSAVHFRHWTAPSSRRSSIWPAV